MTRLVHGGPTRAGLILTVALSALGAAPAGPAWAAESPAPARAGAPSSPARAARPAARISAATLEERFGLRIDRVAVTGSGGLVDLRFTVLDQRKARLVLPDPGHPPTLVAEETGQVLAAPHHGAMRSVRLRKDAACYVLYPNARNAVRPGTRVSVAFGEVRVKSVVAL